MEGGLKWQALPSEIRQRGDVRCRNEHTLVCFPVFSRRP